MRLLLGVPLAIAGGWATPAGAPTFHVHPGGDNANSGLSATEPWLSIDRGQPTRVRAAVSAGDSTIAVERASQLPPGGLVTVDGRNVTCGNRNHTHLLGCTGTADAKVGATVVGAWAPAGAGDVLLLSGGVHFLNCSVDSATAQAGASYAAAVLYAGGAPGAPLTIRGTSTPGQQRTIIDGRDLGQGLRISTSHVVLEDVEVRRGQVQVFEAADVHIKKGRFHGVGRDQALGIEYSTNVSLSRSSIFDVAPPSPFPPPSPPPFPPYTTTATTITQR